MTYLSYGADGQWRRYKYARVGRDIAGRRPCCRCVMDDSANWTSRHLPTFQISLFIPKWVDKWFEAYNRYLGLVPCRFGPR